MTIMTQLSSLVGALNKPTLEAKPTDLEIALARVNADHKSVLIAVKMLTEIAQSNAAANLDMAVVHEERNKGSLQRDADILKTLRELKREVSAVDNRHLTAFEVALRPVLRAIDLLTQNIDKVNAVFVDKVNGLNADIHGLKVDRHDELDAHTYVLNQKLTLVAERLDRLCRILVAKDLLKHPKGVTVAPPKKVKDPTVPAKKGRPEGRKSRTLKERRDWLMDRIQKSRPDKTMLAKYQSQLNEVLTKMAVPMSDKALGKSLGGLIGKEAP
jgi:hypothetical protein